ncbi:MAG: ornithine cyclodeaminase [Armatimonadota bacterium]|nr:ornithine cyclodeaminase [Armatimonadota bacterium]MDR7420932.1 ornithine cyclodeaminase [Armatimonadota bacterium]MDR7453671.1 ornithine cyclodeaminase [Armatimonadota bacterium]MDR7456559.1 ornithine cyclodeaminase [Armatimonadota bacterium]MDR7497996.1 ornithine cyclodeaminase [Armatimonadota bacterium]
MLLLGAADLRALVPMADAIAAVREAFVALSAGGAAVPVRAAVTLPDSDAVFLAMPGALAARGGGAAALGAKLVSVVPANAAVGRPVVDALMVIFDPGSGQPVAVIEGASLTSLRTGAASGLATDLLALPEASIVALFGAGVQARTQLEAICTVRAVTQVRVVARSRERAEAFAAWAREQWWIRGATVVAATDPETAVRGAEVVVTATTSATPVFPGRAVAPGTHVNAVGAFQPHTREVDADLVARAAVFVDSREAAHAEAGDLLMAAGEGRFRFEDVRAEIGEVAAGRAGRRSREEITLFKSVGHAVQDLAVAALAARRAAARERGVRVTLD